MSSGDCVCEMALRLTTNQSLRLPYWTLFYIVFFVASPGSNIGMVVLSLCAPMPDDPKLLNFPTAAPGAAPSIAIDSPIRHPLPVV